MAEIQSAGVRFPSFAFRFDNAVQDAADAVVDNFNDIFTVIMHATAFWQYIIPLSK